MLVKETDWNLKQCLQATLADCVAACIGAAAGRLYGLNDDSVRSTLTRKLRTFTTGTFFPLALQAAKASIPRFSGQVIPDSFELDQLYHCASAGACVIVQINPRLIYNLSNDAHHAVILVRTAVAQVEAGADPFAAEMLRQATAALQGLGGASPVILDPSPGVPPRTEVPHQTLDAIYERTGLIVFPP